jgi:CubicO group peptidase (beta-lactamase class C family)
MTEKPPDQGGLNLSTKFFVCLDEELMTEAPVMIRAPRHTFTSLVLASLVAITACGDRPTASPPTGRESSEARLTRVTDRLQRPLAIEGQAIEYWNIEQRMRQFSVPGVSAAIIDQGRLVAADAWGVMSADGNEPVTTETMFQAGSVSKPVAAILALSLVGEGVLGLDHPINEVLRSWQVPENEFTKAMPVTLRHVITHQAGFTPFSYLIRRSDGAVPSMADLLRGGIHDWPVVTVEFEPGSKHAYSNAGYCVLQLSLEDATGLSLHDFSRGRIFSPLGMHHSTFDEPLSPEVLATAASGHTRQRADKDSKPEPVPVEGKAEIAPGATGGLWSTPSDLARLAVEVMRAYRGESDRLIPQHLADDLLTPQVGNEGLGIYLEGEGPALRAGHRGGMVGFVAQLVFYPNVGKGAVIMANSEGGRWLNKELMAAIADEFDWPGYPVRRSLGTATPEQLRELVGVYSLDASPKTTFTVTLQDGTAIGRINQYPPFELSPTTEADLYVLPRESLEILFRRGEDGNIAKVTLRRAGDAGNAYSRRGES